MGIKQRVENVLEENDYDYSEYSGCFDIAARKRDMLLLKVLDNVDSFQAEQATNLRVLSSHLDASTFVIGTHTRRENLMDNIIYDRFGVFTMTAGTLDSVLSNELPVLYRSKGGLFAEVNPQKLRDARARAGLSQAALAEKLGISKKSVYEHESRRMRAEHATVKKMERILGNVTDPVSVNERGPAESGSPGEGFQRVVSKDMKRMGMKTDFVGQSPFNIIAHSENFLVISDAEERAARAERNAPLLEQFTRTAKKPVLAVTKEELDIGVPSIAEKELRELGGMPELRRFLRRW